MTSSTENRDLNSGVDTNFKRGADGADWYFLPIGYTTYNQDIVSTGNAPNRRGSSINGAQGTKGGPLSFPLPGSKDNQTSGIHKPSINLRR